MCTVVSVVTAVAFTVVNDIPVRNVFEPIRRPKVRLGLHTKFAVV